MVSDAQKRFFYWINERESIRKKKELGLERKPWTTDTILQSYRFCNVRRMDDKVSRWLLTNWYLPYQDNPLMLPAVALARFINQPAALSTITKNVFEDSVSTGWRPDVLKEKLRDYRNNRKPQEPSLFNNAYMVRGNDGVDKVSSVLDFYIASLWEEGKLLIPDRGSMRNTHLSISGRYGFGSFMAGQVVADLRWALKGNWDDRLTWAPMGPGSARGMNRYHGRPPKTALKQDQFLSELLGLIRESKKHLPVALQEILEAHDYQNCLCEFDKYERTLHLEGRPKQKYPGT